MDKSRDTVSIIKSILSEPATFEHMLDLPAEQVQFLQDECDVLVKDLKSIIAHEYETIKHVLNRMRDYKKLLQQLRDRREIYSTFIDLEKGDQWLSLSSNTSLQSDRSLPDMLRKRLELKGPKQTRKSVNFDTLFQTLEHQLIDDSPCDTPPSELVRPKDLLNQTHTGIPVIPKKEVETKKKNSIIGNSKKPVTKKKV